MNRAYIREIVFRDVAIYEAGRVFPARFRDRIVYFPGIVTKEHKAKVLMEIQEQVHYRISIRESGSVEVMSLFLNGVDDPYGGVYDDPNELPEWMQERIATLSLLSFSPPTEEVEGVGRRISKNTFWVEAPHS